MYFNIDSYYLPPQFFLKVHTQNETMAAGTAFAISYVTELNQVTMENLVVFSVLYK